jgi:FkbM family methyltransferase
MFASKLALYLSLIFLAICQCQCSDLSQPSLSAWFVRHFKRLTKRKNLSLYSKQLSPVILQIGAHTGFEKNDPLWVPLNSYFTDCAAEKISWIWILVEPVPLNFKVLKSNFRGREFPGSGQVILENCAIGLSNSTDIMIPFYTVSESIDPSTGFDSISGKQFPDYITQIGSFKREMLLKERRVWKKLKLNIEDYISEVSVKVKSIDSMFQGYDLQFEQLTILLIDTEGYDCKIMNDLDFGRIQAAVLIYEFKHCSAEELDRVHLRISHFYSYRKLDSENEVAFLKG